MDIGFDTNAAATPYYIVDVRKLEKNLAVLKSVSDRAGCSILLAQKAFSMFSLYPLIGKYLCGACASGLFEARLSHEKMGLETHIFSPAYKAGEIDEILQVCDHVIFNSLSQWEMFRGKAVKSGKKIGIRINPECSTQDHAIYDPCSPGSRLGVVARSFPETLPDGMSGIHFHSLCEQNADALEVTLEAVEEKFGHIIRQCEWVNFGGGHHITRPDYDVDKLVSLILRFREKYGVHVYLEPGEAVALNTGYLVSSVVDIISNGLDIAILDTSAACHMPDVLEMPYRPNIIGADEPGKKAHTFRLGGPTCLAGDVIGDYSFNTPLKVGDKLVFCDMAHYTMVKNNMFNGINLPSILIADGDTVSTVKTFGYEDYKSRLS